MPEANDPFRGILETGAGGSYVSDEQELAKKKCPAQFRGEGNVWRMAVMRYRSGNKRGRQSNWKYKSGLTEEEQMHHSLFLLAFLERRSLPDKLQAVAAWMMSEILERPPD